MAGSIAALLAASSADAVTLYWDTNGTAAGFATITGAWNGTSAFWNTDPAGGAGSVTATTTAADDLIISAGTTGTITASTARLASSLAFSANVVTAVSGGTLTIGGTGAANGVFATSTAASTLSTPLTLAATNTAFGFSNSSTGLLTIGTTITGGASAAQTATIGASSTGGVTLSGAIANGASGTVGLVINSSGTGSTTLAGANTFTGGVVIQSGTVIPTISNSGTTSGAFGPSASGITFGNTSGSANATISSGNTVANPITLAAGSTGNTLTFANSLTTNTATFSGAIVLNHDLTVNAQGTGGVTMSGGISGAGNILASGAGNVTLSGALTGSGNISASNSGSLTISGGSSTYTGDLNFTGGQLNLNNAAALGANSGALNFSGARLDNSSAADLVLTSTRAINWNSDFTFLASRALTLATGAVTLGANRIVTVSRNTNASTLTVNGAISDGSNGYSLTKAGLGSLTLNAANTYTGATTVTGGVLNLVAANSSVGNTSAVTVTGSTLNVGFTSGVGVANRLNASAPLTLGGSTGSGILQINAGASSPLNSQAFTTLSLGVGSNQLSSSSATNPGTFSFTAAAGSVYTRAVGSTVRFQTLAGSPALFVNAPTGASVVGSGTNSILIGAVSGTGTNVATDFVQAASAVAAPTYTANTWASGVNTNVTTTYAVPADAATQSLRFNDTNARTVTLAGVNTIESGGILVTSNATSGTNFGTLSTVTGGTLQAASGKDLWVYTAGAGAQDLVIGSVVGDNGTSSLTKSGGRNLYLTNAANTYAGGTYLNEGTLSVVANGSLGATTGGLTFGGTATLQLGGAGAVDLGTRAVFILSGQNGTLDTNGNSLLSSGVISGAGSLSKAGLGTLTLAGANTYTGTTTALRGTLRLDFSTTGAPTANIVASGTPLGIGQYNNSSASSSVLNSTVEIQGKDGTANSQVFSSVSVGRGAGHLNLTAGSSGTLSVSVGTLLRNTLFGQVDSAANSGATIDFAIGAGVTVNTTGSNSAAGILSFNGINHSAATVNGTSWATVSSGTIIPLPVASYSTSYSTSSLNLDASGANTLTSSPNTIRFNSAGAATLSLGAGAVRQLGGGGILVTNNVGGNLTTIAGPAPLAGAGRRDLIIFQNNTAAGGDLQIDAPIVDFQAGAMINTKSGTGRLILNGRNTNAGGTYVNEGTVVVLSDVIAAPTGITGSISDASNQLTVSDASNLFIGQAVSNSTYLPPTPATGPSANANLSYTIIGISGTTVTLSNNALGTAAAGTAFTFSGSAGLGVGATSIHSVAPGATLQFGNGGTTGALPVGQAVINNGTVSINRSNDFIFGNAVSGLGSFVQNGSNTLTVSGNSTYTGPTRVNSGVLLAGRATNAFGTNSAVTVASGATLRLGGFNNSLGSLAGAGTVENGSGTGTTLTLGGDNTSADFSGTLQNGAGGGAFVITKVGGGTQTFSGSVSTTGNINLNAGTAAFSGTVNAPATTLLLVNGATANVSGSVAIPVYLGNTAGTNGLLNIQPGALLNATLTSLTPSFSIGVGSGSAGGVFQTGGAVTFSGQITYGVGGGGASGFYNLSGGSIADNGLATNERFRVGGVSNNSTGVFYQTGGTVTFSGTGPALEVGANSGGGISNSTGVAYFTGGTFTAATIHRIGYDGTTGSVRGEETVAGSAVVTINNTTTLGSTINDTGILNLNGGTFATRQLLKGANGIGRVNFGGGTLRAATGATGASFFSGLTSATVFSGGATVDSNGQALTIAQPLLTPTGSGVTTIPVSNGGVGYVGAPVVSLAGGGGTGATAVANLADDGTGNGTFKIASITVTNPGTDYTSAPTAALTGGGGTGAIPGTVNTGANVSGGLTKIGTGSLRMTGINSYTGPTKVSGGTLEIAGTIDSASVFSVTSGTLLLSNATTPINTATTLTLGDSVNSTSATVTLGNSLNNVTETFGSLALSYNSTFDFGTGAGGQDFSFTGIIRTGSATLSLSNFGSDGTVGNTANDRLFFTTGSAADFATLFPSQSDVVFNGVPGYSAIDMGGGGYEIVPVPEPSSLALLGAMGLGGLLAFRRRRLISGAQS